MDEIDLFRASRPRTEIMIVDDDRCVRDVFREAFSEFKVISASCAEEAIGILRKPNGISLIILDLAMPGQTGLDVLSSMKRLCPGSKVIILTGYSSKEIVVEALRNRADDFLEKPFDRDEMKTVIDRLLAESVDKDAVVHNSSGKIDRVSRFIMRNFDKPLSLKMISAEVHLSPKYLSRLFKENTGMTLSTYRIALRIEAAKVLLMKSCFTISEIAGKLGYKNPDSFMKMFKDLTGLRATAYRKSARQMKTRRMCAQREA